MQAIQPCREPSSVSKFAGMLSASRAAAGTLKLDVDIPRWYDGSALTGVNCNGTTKDAHRCVIDTADITTLMDYVDTGAGQVTDGPTEVTYAGTAGKRVVLGAETGHEADGVTYDQELRSYNGKKGTSYFEGEQAVIQSALNGQAGYGGAGNGTAGPYAHTMSTMPGIAAHHYDSLVAHGSYVGDPVLDNF